MTRQREPQLLHARFLKPGTKIEWQGRKRVVKKVTLSHPRWNEGCPTYTIQFANGQTEIALRVWAF